jgi:hypothetical protein
MSGILILAILSDTTVIRFSPGFQAKEGYFAEGFRGEQITWRLGLGLVASPTGLRIRGQDTDLDDNGWPDITVSCGEWYADSIFRVFLNKGGRFELFGVQYAWGDRLFLDGHSISDFNANGLPDLVIDIMGNFEYPDTTQVYSLLLWDWPWKGRIDSLASWCTEASVSADLNSDGYEDLIMAVFRDSVKGLDNTKSVIYWGGPFGFSEERKTLLPTLGCHGATVADLNRDGYLDIVFANTYASWGYENVDSYIYWGGPEGYSPGRRTSLDTYGAYGVTVGDLNKDGWLDLVFPQREAEKSAIFYGNPAGFSYRPNLEIYSRGATAAWLEDLNRDGWVDLILARKITNDRPPTIIYWNNHGTFSKADTTCLPAPGAYGLFSEDYNRDGWPDILILNKENSATDQNTYAQVYYNAGHSPYFSGSCRVDTLPVYAAGRGRTMDFHGNVYNRIPKHILILPTVEPGKWASLDSFRVFGDTAGARINARYQCRGPNGSVWLGPGADSISLGLRVAIDILFDPRFASSLHIDSVYLFWHECQEPFAVKRFLRSSSGGDSLYFWNPSESALLEIYNITGQMTQSFGLAENEKGSVPVNGPSGVYIARLLVAGREVYRLRWPKIR